MKINKAWQSFQSEVLRVFGPTPPNGNDLQWLAMVFYAGAQAAVSAATESPDTSSALVEIQGEIIKFSTDLRREAEEGNEGMRPEDPK